jgi:II/X family phage/plasmid replication protein
MIDWIKAIIPLEHSSCLADGHVICITQDGEVEWSINRRLAVEGSHDSSLHIQSDISTRNPETGFYTHIVFDGNPVKFFQGHNLWGTDDLNGLMIETVHAVSKFLNLTPTVNDWDLILKGQYQLKRVDSTMMIALGSKADVQAFLYSAERTAHMRYKGQGIMTKGTLYFGKHSRRESLKMYAKGVEIRAKGHELPKGLNDLQELYNWADDKLRLEACTRSMQLKDIGLQLACNWDENTPSDTLYRLLNGLNMSEQHTLSAINLDGLPPRLVLLYHNWKDGHDIRAMLPKNTFYRYRRQLLEHGVDIAIKQGNRSEPNPNVIEFRRVLRPERCDQIPAWAFGTALMFEPRARMPSYQALFSAA